MPAGLKFENTMVETQTSKVMKTLICSLLILTSSLFMVFVSCHKTENSIDPKVTPNDFLSGTKYDKLIIEVNYVSGYEPTEATINSMVSFLETKINKPGGIEIQKKEISSGQTSFYTLTDIQNIEKHNRKNTISGNTLAAYILFIDKDYSLNANTQSKVLGITYGKSSIVIFENTIRQYSGGITQPSVTRLETIVVEHEFGHLLGLTNNGSKMQVSHQDSPNGSHCSNENCLMHYSVETTDVIDNLMNNIPTLDNNCLNDLKANGGK